MKIAKVGVAGATGLRPRALTALSGVCRAASAGMASVIVEPEIEAAIGAMNGAIAAVIDARPGVMDAATGPTAGVIGAMNGAIAVAIAAKPAAERIAIGCATNGVTGATDTNIVATGTVTTTGSTGIVTITGATVMHIATAAMPIATVMAVACIITSTVGVATIAAGTGHTGTTTAFTWAIGSDLAIFGIAAIATGEIVTTTGAVTSDLCGGRIATTTETSSTSGRTLPPEQGRMAGEGAGCAPAPEPLKATEIGGFLFYFNQL